MILNFYKYQGAGNDFVILDNREGSIELTTKQIRNLCDRRFGVGGDGLMLLNKHTDYDFEMKYYNADGRESSMCGNGGRCLTKFAYDRGIFQTTYRFLAIDGMHEAYINSDGTIALKMNDVTNIKPYHSDVTLNTGSPHYVKLVTNVMDMDIYKRGREIRYNKDFEAEGINVNFVEQLDEHNRIIVRTYERGVEDETLSCGTGVTAAAIICNHNDNGFNHIDVQTLGGYLSVEYDKNGNHFTNVWLIGPAVKVFEGTIEIN